MQINRVGKTRDLFKKTGDTEGRSYSKMGTIRDRNGKDLTEAEGIKKRLQEYTEFSTIQSLSHIRLFATPWTAACQASLSSNNSWSLLKLMSIESVMPSNPLIVPFSSRLQSFPASGSFQMSQFLASGGQSIGVSASTSVLCWISLQSKGLSRVFSNTTVQKHQFFGAQLSL